MMVLATSVILTGCVTTTEYVPACPDEIPDRPVLGPLSDETLRYLSDRSIKNIIRNERIMLDHIRTLEILIDDCDVGQEPSL